ncbi:unnamed protein product, partial [Urochloa humidicola]
MKDKERACDEGAQVEKQTDMVIEHESESDKGDVYSVEDHARREGGTFGKRTCLDIYIGRQCWKSKTVCAEDNVYKQLMSCL